MIIAKNDECKSCGKMKCSCGGGACGDCGCGKCGKTKK